MKPAAPGTRKLRLATTSLAGCFGCHMSFLDIDTRLLDLLEHVELDCSPLTDIKVPHPDCDIGLIEGAVCNAENVHVLRTFRARCKLLLAVGACAVTGGLPAQRNQLALPILLETVYHTAPGLVNGRIPNDPELPLLLDRVYPLHEVVHIDYWIPGCPPSADTLWAVLSDLLAGRTPRLAAEQVQYD